MATERVKKTLTNNLPLPRELRDQIYDALFEPSTNLVQASPSTSALSFPVYRFSTGIFAVNRTMGTEAEEVFHKKHTLVYVVQPSELVQASTPTITADKGRAISAWTRGKCSLRVCFGYSNAIDDTSPQRFSVILGRDLHRLCLALEMDLFEHSWSLPHTCLDDLLLDGNTYFSEKLGVLSSASITFSLASTGHREMTAQLEGDLLSQFESCNFSGLDVTIRKSLRGEDAARALSHRLSPITVSLQAMSWSFLGSLVKTQRQRADEICSGLAVSTLPVDLAMNAWVRGIFSCYCLDNITETPNLEPLARSSVVFLDILTTVIFLAIRHGDVRRAVHYWLWQQLNKGVFMEALSNKEVSDVMPLEDERKFHPGIMWAATLLSIILTPTRDTVPEGDLAKAYKEKLRDAQAVLKEIRTVAPDMSGVKEDLDLIVSIEQDSEMISEIMEQDVWVNGMLQKLSLSRMEAVPYTTAKAYEFTIPDTIVGWCDTAFDGID